MAESKEKLKNLLMVVKEESEQADLKPNIQNTKIMAPTPIFLPEKSHGQRILVGYSPWGHKSWTLLSEETND